MSASPAWTVVHYHEQTKHRFGRFARGPGFLDWETQPNPFRTFEGAPSLLLPLLKRDPPATHPDLYRRNQNQPWDLTLESIGAFFELSLGLSAWKQISGGPRWALRMNPSSGNLHPTEAYAVLPPLLASPRRQAAAGTEVPGGLYHYNAYQHSLERRAELTSAFGQRLKSHFSANGFLVGLTSIWWREAWKYGERAWRYCQHDLGHGLAGLSLAASLLGWRMLYLNALSTEEVGAVLGTDRTVWPTGEQEHPEILCFVGPGSLKALPRHLPADWEAAMRQVPLQGTPNRLSPDHKDWDLIPDIAAAVVKPATPEASVRLSEVSDSGELSTLPAARLIRQRRSALAMDGVTSIAGHHFEAILRQALPRHGAAPFDLELAEPAVHLAVMVHRVEGYKPGLYLLVRQESHSADLKRSLRREFLWQKVSDRLPLYRLSEAALEAEAARISCHQEIAAAGAFSLGMVARFADIVDRHPWRYPQLFWECGMIGQVLYLEAEAAGLRATGIGCFFDDAMHELLGLRNNAYQSLYHFTVGKPVDDPRLSTELPYAHLPVDRL